MASEVAAAAAATDEQQGVPTSLRLLRLQSGFRSMMRAGLERLDEQTFLSRFHGQAEERHLRLMWQLLLRQREAIVAAAEEEMATACAEVGLQQQLEELEALVLERGLLAAGSAGGAAPLEPAALPSAVEAAARAAAKQAEKQQLTAQLQELRAQQAAAEAELAGRRAAAAEVLRDFDARVCDQVDKVYRAAAQWLRAGRDGCGQLAGEE